MQLINVPLDRIRPNPWQTRLRLEHTHVLPLAVDIFRNGLMHPPAGRLLNAGGNIVLLDSFNTSLADGVAMILAEGGYIQLAVGHNRAAAFDVLAYGPAHCFAELEGYTDGPDPDPGRYGAIPVQLAEYTDQQMAAVAWSENAQRKDLTPLEEAKAIKKVIDDFGWTQAEAAEHFGLARATVANKLRLLQLPEEVGRQLHTGAISERAAGALLPLYQVPDRVRQTIVTNEGNSYYSEANIVDHAIAGEPSETLRRMVNEAIRRATVPHKGDHVPLDVEVAKGHGDVHAAKCTDCPLLLRQGSETRCGDGDCYDIKAESWKAYRLSIAGEHMPPLTDADRWFLQFFEDSHYRENYDLGKQIVADGCDKLRTCYYPELLNSDRKVVHVGAMPDLPIVCSAGNSCACLPRLRNEAAKEPDPEKIAEQQEQERWIREVRQPLVNALAKSLDAMQPAAWAIIAEYAFRHVRAGEGPWSDFCAKVAEHMVKAREPYSPHQDFNRSRNDLQQWLTDAGIFSHATDEESEPATDTCDDCGDELQPDELISCSCIGLYCENCYDENGHRTHDSNTDNAALRELIQDFGDEAL